MTRLGVAVIFVSTLCGVMLRGFFEPGHLIGTTVGFALVRLVYGCYGLLAGADRNDGGIF